MNLHFTSHLIHHVIMLLQHETHRFCQNKRVLHEVNQVFFSRDNKEEMSCSQASVEWLI